MEGYLPKPASGRCWGRGWQVNRRTGGLSAAVESGQKASSAAVQAFRYAHTTTRPCGRPAEARGSNRGQQAGASGCGLRREALPEVVRDQSCRPGPRQAPGACSGWKVRPPPLAPAVGRRRCISSGLPLSTSTPAGDPLPAGLCRPVLGAFPSGTGAISRLGSEGELRTRKSDRPNQKTVGTARWRNGPAGRRCSFAPDRTARRRKGDSSAGGLAQAAAVAAAVRKSLRPYAHGAPQQGRRHLCLVGRASAEALMTAADLRRRANSASAPAVGLS